VFVSARYSTAIRDLLAEPRLPELGPGQPNLLARAALTTLTPENAFNRASDPKMAMACISGLWLLHDFLDESHAISQDLDTPTGSYWHGIMHRREPDAPNAKYWFRQVGNHPVFEMLAEEFGKRWDPFVFIDRCEACRGKGGDEETACRQIQFREWEIFFDWCHERTIISSEPKA
jgi:hypothetical protein